MRTALLTLLLFAACTTEPQPSLRALVDLTGAAQVVPLEGAPGGAERRLAVDTPAGRVVLDLDRNDDLFAPGYVEQRLDATGEPLPHPPSAWANAAPCWYQGDVVDDGGSWLGSAAVSTCQSGRHDALRGLLLVGGGAWEIRPQDAAHLVTRVSAPAFDNLSGGLDPDPAATEPSQLGQAPPPGLRLVELLIVNDQARTVALGGSPEADAATIANAADAIFAAATTSESVRVTLTAQITMPSTDPWSVGTLQGETDQIALLTAFDAWATGPGVPPHDARQLLTGRDLEGATIGWATQAGICVRASGGGLVQTTFTDGVHAVTSAHELGHGLGLVHDGTGSAGTCATSGFVMQSTTCTNCPTAPTAFSTCSESSLTAFLATSQAGCLLDRPMATWGGEVCGDGVVEGDETCDCGTDDCSVIDPCCDGATCRLATGAACSALDPCCDAATCGIVPPSAARACRPGRSDCDEPELCDGFRSTCPGDAVAPAGGTCFDALGNRGACYAGDCVAYPTQCTEMDDSGGGPYIAELTCLGYFGDPCLELSCTDPSGTCIYWPDTAGVSMPLADGTPCDAGRQCLDTTCVTSSALDAQTDLCPDDPAKTASGICGCGTPDVDTDGDGLLDCFDTCPNGIIDPGETCDDGNATRGDGCSDACQREALVLDPISPGQVGVVNTLTSRNARPGSTTWFLISLAPGTTAVPGCRGVTLPTAAPVAFLPATNVPSGTASSSVTPPLSIRGSQVAFHAVDLSTCRVSNTVLTRF